MGPTALFHTTPLTWCIGRHSGDPDLLKKVADVNPNFKKSGAHNHERDSPATKLQKNKKKRSILPPLYVATFCETVSSLLFYSHLFQLPLTSWLHTCEITPLAHAIKEKKAEKVSNKWRRKSEGQISISGVWFSSNPRWVYETHFSISAQMVVHLLEITFIRCNQFLEILSAFSWEEGFWWFWNPHFGWGWGERKKSGENHARLGSVLWIIFSCSGSCMER